MTRRNYRILVCVVVLFIVVFLTACSNESEVLQERIDELEVENEELLSTISSMRSDLERAQADVLRTQGELQDMITAQQAAAELSADNDQSGAMVITYAGEPNQDMSWPLSYGDLQLNLRVNLSDLVEGVEIVWHSTNENVFLVFPSEDGLSATVTPLATGSAELVATVGDQETRSWVRVT